VEEARAVIARLDRIEAMERANEPASLLLRELELLVADTESWLECEGQPAVVAREALERCLRALERAPVEPCGIAGVARSALAEMAPSRL
jgi:hypothetical protein